jgi:hypothetical protein
MKKLLSVCAFLALGTLSVVPALAAASRPTGLPDGVIQLSPCVRTMGEHWANPKNLPFGPIYGVYDGKVIFSEVMIDQKLFAQGKGWRDIVKPLPGHAIDHVDIAFNPHGHEGYPVPHYDVHAYYVPHNVHMAYCPGGLPNPESPE